MRDAVAAVGDLLDGSPDQPASVSEVAKHLAISLPSAWRRVADAIKGGWLVNDETRRGQRAKLRIGEPLPATGLLPTPEQLGEMIASAALPDDLSEDQDGQSGSAFTFSPDSGRPASPHQGLNLGGGGASPPVDPENVKTQPFASSAASAGDWVDVPDPSQPPEGPAPSLWDVP